MKPAPFDYVRPAGIDEACALLAGDDGARLIAGGQTLVPLMAMRLARPTRLIDIARIPDLAHIRAEGDIISIGAATKQSTVEDNALVRAKLPLLAAVMPFVGHTATRTRGTIGGSLANADPAAEIALAAVTLDATIVYREGADVREISTTGFFVGPMITALPHAALVLAVRFPIWRETSVGVGFHEINARKSDFAFASAAAQIALDPNGICQRLAIGVGAVTACPMRLDNVSKALAGKRLETNVVRDAVEAALTTVEPLSDPHASAEYRRRAATTLAVRAIMDAEKAARGSHAR